MFLQIRFAHLKVPLLLLDADGQLLLEVLHGGVERGQPPLQVELCREGDNSTDIQKVVSKLQGNI